MITTQHFFCCLTEGWSMLVHVLKTVIEEILMLCFITISLYHLWKQDWCFKKNTPSYSGGHCAFVSDKAVPS